MNVKNRKFLGMDARLAESDLIAAGISLVALISIVAAAATLRENSTANGADRQIATPVAQRTADSFPHQK